MKLYEAVNELVDEVLKEDPIDWGYLQIDEDNAKHLVISSMCEHWEELVSKGDSQNDINIAMLTVASKLALENFCLHLQLLQR